MTSAKRSKKSVRQARILQVLEVNPAIRVNVLAEELSVSAETVRRDLSELDETGRIQRTYGGAVKTRQFEPALSDRLKLHISERERIARAALELIEDADCIFIGGGATTLQFAQALRDIERRLTVITASFSIATELSTNPLIEVMSLPGVVDPKEGQVCGPDTVTFISQYRARYAIMGASGIDGTGVSEALLTAAQVYKAMIEHSDATIILADSSKFERRALQLILGWGPGKILVTEQAPLLPWAMTSGRQAVLYTSRHT